MKNVTLPKINLKIEEKLWLTTLYQYIKNNEKPSYRKLRTQLHPKLSLDFHPNNMDDRLISKDGTEITLLGIFSIDSKSDIINKANTVIKCVRDILFENPDSDTIEASLVSKKIDIPTNEVGLVFSLMTPYGRFWNSASGSNTYYGYRSIGISSDNNNTIFNQYLYFNGIEELIEKYYKEYKGRENLKKANNKNQNHKNTSINGVMVDPIFTSRIEYIDTKLCFVLMPFTTEWSKRVYRKYIRENIELLGLQCLRADNLTGSIIIEDIWTKINQAAFLIADVTDKNPNVMYELGIAHTLGKPVVLITQDTKGIPFDFKHLRHHVYQDNSDGQEEFKSELKKIVLNLYGEFYPDSILNTGD